MISTRLHRALAPGLALLLAMTAGPKTALAGSIGFQTESRVSSGDGLQAEVDLTNTGDEAASDVLLVAEALGQVREGEVQPTIGPGKKQTWSFRLADAAPPGLHVIVLRCSYQDDNGHPFEVVSLAEAPVGPIPGPRITGNLVIGRVPARGKTKARLSLKLPAGRTGPTEVEMVMPNALRIDQPRQPVTFDRNGRASIELDVSNADLLPGTSVNVFALVHGTVGGVAQTDVIRGLATVGPATPLLVPADYYRAALALLGVQLLLEAWAAWRARRSTGGAA